MRYDNETGKGDHAHYGNEERPYRFVSLDELMADFYRDVQALTGRRIK
ncbi:MAG: toxin-antitoxin system TumE family protein [Sulfuricaulis sp.]